MPEIATFNNPFEEEKKTADSKAGDGDKKADGENKKEEEKKSEAEEHW